MTAINTYANLRITLDSKALVANFRLLQAKVGAAVQITPAVKANGYGLGVEVVVPLLDQAGADGFYVANIDEALTTRTLTTKPIYILGGFTHRDDLALFHAHQLTPVVNTLPQIDLITANAPGLPLVLHIDTGMNRLGLNVEDVQTLINDPAATRDLNIVHIMSHFACADEINHSMTQKQAHRFDTALTSLRRAYGCDIAGSLANSSGIFRDPSYHHQLVRPGMALYGLNPTPETANPMYPVVGVRARVLQTRTAKQGDSVGYGATHHFDRDTILITIGGGYADGLTRALSNKGHVYFNDVAYPMVGRVSMDLISLAVPDGAPIPQLGDWVDIVGPYQTADDMAAQAGTIGYEILTQLSQRAERMIQPYTGAQPMAYSTSNVAGSRAVDVA